MTRIECETAIAEHLKSIYEIYKEYNPDVGRLEISLGKRLRQNDFGSWTEAYFDVSNRKFPKDDKLISFVIETPIINDEYWETLEKTEKNLFDGKKGERIISDDENMWFGRSFFCKDEEDK